MIKYRVTTENGYIETIFHEEALRLQQQFNVAPIAEFSVSAEDVLFEERLESIGAIHRDIDMLEKLQTPRRLRESALGVQGSIDFLQDIENQIAALRISLASLTEDEPEE